MPCCIQVSSQFVTRLLPQTGSSRPVKCLMPQSCGREDSGLNLVRKLQLFWSSSCLSSAPPRNFQDSSTIWPQSVLYNAQQTHHWSSPRLILFFSMAQQPLVDQGLFMNEASRSYSDTPHSVGLLCSSDQPDAETSIGRHTTITRDRYPCPREDLNPKSQQRAATAPSLRPRGRWDQSEILRASCNKPYNRYSCGLGDERSVWCAATGITPRYWERHVINRTTAIAVDWATKEVFGARPLGSARDTDSVM
jgi:hypothetical protein